MLASLGNFRHGGVRWIRSGVINREAIVRGSNSCNFPRLLSNVSEAATAAPVVAKKKKTRKKKKSAPTQHTKKVKTEAKVSESNISTKETAAEEKVPKTDQQQHQLIKADWTSEDAVDVHQIEAVASQLENIHQLQKDLPSLDQIKMLLEKASIDLYPQAIQVFEMYRKFGTNSFEITSDFLTPGILASCQAKNPQQALLIASDMIKNGKTIDNDMLQLILTTIESCRGKGEEAIQLLEIMELSNYEISEAEYNTLLKACHESNFVDGALRILKALRAKNIPVSMKTYLHWLSRSSSYWRADVFVELLTELRIVGLEPKIPSLTSLEPRREDGALTVMEGVRAVGLDPHFAMSVIYTSINASVNNISSQPISKSDVHKAKKRFGALKVHELEWDIQPIPQLLETQAAGLLLNQETFRRLPMKKVKRIENYMHLLPIDANLSLNLRKQLQRMSLLVNTSRVRRNKKSILQEYESGKSLVDLAVAHNYPPVSLLRVILDARGLKPLEIKAAVNSPKNSVMNSRDRNELNKATQYDSIHKSDPFLGNLKITPDGFENSVVDFIKSKGIRIKTQAELYKDQKAKYGRSVMTPDILFLDPVLINGTPVRWIDAKSYYGAHIVNKNIIRKQLRSYYNEWGPGAVVFGMGFSDMLSIPGVICLDPSPFPTTKSAFLKTRLKSYFNSFANLFNWKESLSSEFSEPLDAQLRKEMEEREREKNHQNDKETNPSNKLE